MPPKDGDRYDPLPMYIRDSDGEVQAIPRPLQEFGGKIESGEMHIIEGDDQPEWILPPDDVPEELVARAINERMIIPYEFRFTAKRNREFNRKIRKECNRRKRLIRDIARKRERFRRAMLKYGVADKRADLAFLLYTVAVQRLMIWREEAKHGYAKVPERSRTQQAEMHGRR